MSECFAVELYFDPALENQVLKAWNVLARRQISTRLIATESRPHLTLLSLPAGAGDPHRLLPLLRSLAARHEPLPLSLSAVAALPGDPALLFLAPTPSLPLLLLHSHLADALRKEPLFPDPLPDAFRPDLWLPLCALAPDVPRTQAAEAFAVLRDLIKIPVSGYATEIAIVEYSPAARELFSFPLGSLSSETS